MKTIEISEIKDIQKDQLTTLERKLWEMALALQYVLDGIPDHHVLESDSEDVRQLVIKALRDAERIVDINTNLETLK